MNRAEVEAALARKGAARKVTGAVVAAARLPLTLATAVYVFCVVLPWGRSLDRAAFAGRLDAGRHLLGMSQLLLGMISVPLLAAALVALIWWARRTGRFRDGLVCAASVTGAAVSAETLKLPLPAATQHGIALRPVGPGSFPSGHATIATAVALAFLALTPHRRRARWIGPAVMWALVVAVATVTAGWHRPSDAVGGILLAVTWHRALWAASLVSPAWVSQRAGSTGRGARRGPPAALGTSDRQPAGESALGRPQLGWRPVGWWVVATVLELTVLMLPSPAESPWEPAAVRHYLAVALMLVSGGAVMLWASSAMLIPVGRVPQAALPRGRGVRVEPARMVNVSSARRDSSARGR